MVNPLLRLLSPRSVAVIGASADPDKFSGRILPFLQRHGYQGVLYPINSRQTEVMGLRAYPDLESVPGEVECVIYSIDASKLDAILSACERKSGVRLLVVTSAGFAERGDAQGHRLQARLTEYAKRTGTRVIGPNCIGFFNPVDGVAMAAAAVLEWPALACGHVGLVSQSGGLAFGTILIGAHEKGIGLSRVITTGNEADTSLAEWAHALLEDDHTDALALTIEGLRDGAAFVDMLAYAQRLHKPVVILKTGRTSLGKTMAMSHTGSIAGSQAVFKSVCADYGATLVEDLDELYEIAQMFAKLRRTGKLRRDGAPAGVAALSISGGHIGLFADLGSEAGVPFAELAPDTQQALGEQLKRPPPILNPVDLTGGTVSDPGVWGRCIGKLLKDDGVDVVLPILTIARNYDAVTADIVAISDSTDKSLLVAWPGSAREGRGKAALRDSLVPIFDSQRNAARGAAALAAFRQSIGWPRARGAGIMATMPGLTECLRRHATGQDFLGEHESKQILAQIGVPVPRETAVSTPEQAVAAAHDIGFPVVLKGLHPGIGHKSDAGLVQLDLRSPVQVQEAYANICAAVAARRLNRNSDFLVLVQEMIRGGIELILGVKRDPTFGPTVVFGLGGVYVEIFRDIAVHVAPITHAQARAMLEEVKAIALLKGVRGRRSTDLDAIATLLVALGDFAVANQDVVREVEINPLIVADRDADALRAVDALIVFNCESPPGEHT